MISSEDRNWLSIGTLQGWHVVLAVGLICTVSLALVAPASLSQDAHWLVYLAAQMISGATAYADFFEVNPPLIIWLSMPPAWVSHLTGLALMAVFKAYIYLAIAISLFLFGLILGPLKLANERVLMVGAAYITLVLPAAQFGQREHLMVILALPFLAVVAGRANGTMLPSAQVVSATLLASVGFCIKPYFVLIPAVLEIYLLIRIGGASLRRVEPYLMVAVGLSYLVGIGLFAPHYFTHVLVYAHIVYDADHAAPVSHMLRVSAPILTISCLGALMFVSLKQKLSHIPPIFAVLILAMLAAFGGLLLQFKGWANHAYPAQALLLLAIIGGLGALLRLTALKLVGRTAPLMLIFAGAVIAAMPLVQFERQTKQSLFFGPIIDQHPGTQTILIISSSLHNGFPLVNDKRLTWGSRFPSLWLTRSIQKQRAAGETQPRLAEIERFTRRAVTEDLARYRPQLVFVHAPPHGRHFAGIPFDYLEDYAREPGFVREWSHYKQNSTIGEFKLYLRCKRWCP